jgi:signal transduction histidine kinase
LEPAKIRKIAPPAASPLAAETAAAEVDIQRNAALRLVARREYDLRALSEMSRGITVSMDLYEIADLVLLSLMGEMAASSAALWLTPKDSVEELVLVRCHGMHRSLATAVGRATYPPDLLDDPAEGSGCWRLEDLRGMLGANATLLLERAKIAAMVPIAAHGQLIGMLALGQRIGKTPYGEIENLALQTSVAIAGIALQNARLYNRILEQNRQLRIANQHLQQLDQLKSEFLQSVNHELRTPLTIVMGNLDCLKELDHADDLFEQLVDVSMEESRRLMALIESVLDLSAITEDQLEAKLETGDLTKLLTGFYEERLPGVTDELREFDYEEDSDVPTASYDAERVLQNLNALVDNAVKFTSPSTRITLRLGKRIEEGRNWAAISIEDTGPGMPEEKISTVFESFRQLDGSTTRQTGGLGIGLALARRLAEKMGGHLKIETELGSGSKFYLLLPMDHNNVTPLNESGQ